MHSHTFSRELGNVWRNNKQIQSEWIPRTILFYFKTDKPVRKLLPPPAPLKRWISPFIGHTHFPTNLTPLPPLTPQVWIFPYDQTKTGQ